MAMYGWVARRAFAYWRRKSWKRAVMRMETENAVHRRRKRQAVRRTVQERFGLNSSVVTPVMIVQGANQIGQRFFEMSGMPNSVLGKFTGEVVHTLDGSWIWTGFSWESYIYPG